MRYIWQHIKAIIATYRGEVPLTHYLKSYFRQYPVLGSRDRKLISAMAYSWYRCSKGLTGGSEEETLVTCARLCSLTLPDALTKNEPFAPLPFDIEKLLDPGPQFSTGIHRADWLQSMLSQPDLFIRIIKQKETVLRTLGQAGISYKQISDSCFALPNGSGIDSLLPPAAYVVQDASSQQTGNYFKAGKGDQWLDCCAGAGGKSLLLKSLRPDVQLTVSDRRESIIHNLKQRFRQYGYTTPRAIITDASDAAALDKSFHGQTFDHIICDAPCSGSGTWTRTPEQLYFFKPDALNHYSTLQAAIATNITRYLKPGGTIYYITCSVFRQENEDVVSQLVQRTGLALQEQQLINGLSVHADSMFIAVLKKSS